MNLHLKKWIGKWRLHFMTLGLILISMVAVPVSANTADVPGAAYAEQYREEIRGSWQGERRTSIGSIEHPAKAPAGTFVKNGSQWSYQYKDGTIAKNACLVINRKIYYFNKYGQRWYGMHTLNGKRYYFGTKNQGWLYRNKLFSYKGDTYFTNRDGTLKKGWFTVEKSGKTYYFGSDGKAYKGRKKINGVNYYFSSSGELFRTGVNLKVSSDCAILIDADTGKIIFGKNENMRHANASTTKILTCILALENCKLNEKVKVSANAAAQEPVKLYMQKGEIFYLKDLLYSLMLPSHNDTAVAIAEHVSGSEKKFVNLMNKKAVSLGCMNTHFATPNGLDAGLNHYTTASDLSKIARYAIKNPVFRKMINTASYDFTSLNTKRHFYVSTTNSLLGYFPGVVGMKTGYTNKAGYCFVGLCNAKSGKKYISVVLGAPNSSVRWNDSRTLLKYAYAH